MPKGMSTDGSVIVGQGAGSGAFRWTNATGFTSAGGWSAYAVSDDGSIIAGTTTGYPGSEAYRRTFTSSVEALGFLYPGDVHSQATGISVDGNTIVGFSDQKPFVWDSINGMRDLRQLMILNGLDTTYWSSFYTNGIARISADGKTIAGNGASMLGNEVWVAVNVENVN